MAHIPVPPSGGSTGDRARAPSPRPKLSKVKGDKPDDTDGSRNGQIPKRQSPTAVGPTSSKPNPGVEKPDGGGDEAPAPRSPDVDETESKPSSLAPVQSKTAKPLAKSKRRNLGAQGAAGVHEADNSSDDEGDGFRIVVGRDREAANATAMPMKRFLRGEMVSTPLVTETTVL